MSTNLDPVTLTVIQNGRDANINGIETDVGYQSGGFSLNAAAAYTDAKTKGNICGSILSDANCSGDTLVTKSGSRLPVTPKFKASATARYTWRDLRIHSQRLSHAAWMSQAMSRRRFAPGLLR